MDDRYDEVLEKYDFSVSKMSRARGAMVLWTDKGIKLLCETHASAGRLVWENKVKNHLKENGFERIDTFVINMDQTISTLSRNGVRYLVKDWFNGRECDLCNLSEVRLAASNLARLHISLQKARFEAGENIGSERAGASAGKGADASAGKGAGASAGKGADASTGKGADASAGKGAGASASAGTDASAGKGAGTSAGKGTDEGGSERADASAVEGTAATKEDTLAIFVKHNRELNHIRNYLKGKKFRNEFESRLLSAYPALYGQANESVEGIKNISLGEVNIIHGSYTYHNVIMCEDGIATTSFDKCTYGYKLMDLYYFLRKTMEKNDWKEPYGMAVLEGYDEVYTLENYEKQALACLLAYPEKFWKLASHYMNGKKTWLSVKNMEKLELILAQMEARQDFIAKIC